MWVCPKCSVNAYSENCPICGLAEAEATRPEDAFANLPADCPLCGGPVDRGCIYGSDRGWRLRWYAGPPSFGANFATGLGGGDPVGSWAFSRGPYAPGIR